MSSEAEEKSPSKPRKRRPALRIMLGCGLFVLVLIAVAGLVFVPNMIDEAPYDAPDLAVTPPDIPPHDNAAEEFLALWDERLPDLGEDLEFSFTLAVEEEQAFTFLEENRDQYEEYWRSILLRLEAIDELSERPHIQFEVSTKFGSGEDHVHLVKHTAELQHARLQVTKGRQDSALLLRQLESWGKFASKFSRSQSSLITALVVVAYSTFYSEQVQKFVHASEGDLRPLRKVLGEFRTDRQQISDALRVEYQQFRSVLMNPQEFDLPSGSSPMRVLLLPNRTDRQYAEMLRASIKEYETFGRISMTTNVRQPEGVWDFLVEGNSAGRALIFLLMPHYSSIAEKGIRSATIVRATELMVALMIYEEESGALPEKLADLVPGVLPAVPIDPRDQLPLRYDRERRVVWGVGIDGVDDGGTDEPRAKDAADIVVSIPKRGE